MYIIDKIEALFQVLQPSELDAMSPVKRQRFASLLKHWHELTEGSGRKIEMRSSGVLQALKFARGHE